MFVKLLQLKSFYLLLLVLSERAHSTCVWHQYCDNNEETLAAIASDPQNIQQLENMFYPVNGANLASPALVVYFLNYTGPLPQQCDAGLYPWESYPKINTTYQEMEWYLWTTQFMSAIASPLKPLEFGLYIPTVTFLFFFNRTAPFVQPTPIACLAVPYRETPSMEKITIELLSIISPERYTEQLLDVHNQGVFSVGMAEGIPEHDVRIYSQLNQLGNPKFKVDSIFNGVQWMCGCGALLLVYHYAGSWLQLLKTTSENHREWLAVFWATANVSFVLNVYSILKVIANTCIRFVADCWCNAIAIPIIFVLSVIPVIFQFCKFKDHLPSPRIWQLCFPQSYVSLARVYMLLCSWSICFSFITISGLHIPYAILLLSTNYLLYGTALAAVYLLLPTAICLTALIYTIDQMFCINMEFRLTCRQGIQQVYRLLVAGVAFFGAAGVAISVHFLLYLSKNGQKTQSLSTSVFTIFSTVFLIVAPWAIRTAVRKIQQDAFRKWETMHEEANTCSTGTHE